MHRSALFIGWQERKQDEKEMHFTSSVQVAPSFVCFLIAGLGLLLLNNVYLMVQSSNESHILLAAILEHHADGTMHGWSQ
jgi:hypothetical protein